MPYSFISFPLAAASHNSMFFSAGVTYWAPAQGISLVTLMIESTVAWRPMAMPNASGGASAASTLLGGHRSGRQDIAEHARIEQNDGALGRNGYLG